MNDDNVTVQEESNHAFSSNLVKSLELLKTFDFEENEKVFIYIQILEQWKEYLLQRSHCVHLIWLFLHKNADDHNHAEW